MNFVRELPIDVILRILYFVPLKGIFSFLRTCKCYSLYLESSNSMVESKGTFWENIFFVAFGYRMPIGSYDELKRKVIEETKWNEKQYKVSYSLHSLFGVFSDRFSFFAYYQDNEV